MFKLHSQKFHFHSYPFSLLQRETERERERRGGEKERRGEKRRGKRRTREERKGDRRREFLPLLTSYAVLHYSEFCFCHLKIYPITTLCQCSEVFLIPFQSCIVQSAYFIMFKDILH